MTFCKALTITKRLKKLFSRRQGFWKDFNFLNDKIQHTYTCCHGSIWNLCRICAFHTDTIRANFTRWTTHTALPSYHWFFSRRTLFTSILVIYKFILLAGVAISIIYFTCNAFTVPLIKGKPSIANTFIGANVASVFVSLLTITILSAF